MSGAATALIAPRRGCGPAWAYWLQMVGRHCRTRSEFFSTIFKTKSFLSEEQDIQKSARELLAWRETVLHLHSLGLPAAVPEFAAAWLRREGIRADWTVAA